MTATNHALTGAFIGLTVSNPMLAVPIALLSHFICDALPHFGSSESNDTFLSSRQFKLFLLIDAGLCMLLVLLLSIAQPQQWLLAAVCAFIATAPDLAHIPGFVRTLRGKHFLGKRPNWYTRFAIKIQWFEKPIGALFEAAWLVGFLVLIAAYL